MVAGISPMWSQQHTVSTRQGPPCRVHYVASTMHSVYGEDQCKVKSIFNPKRAYQAQCELGMNFSWTSYSLYDTGRTQSCEHSQMCLKRSYSRNSFTRDSFAAYSTVWINDSPWFREESNGFNPSEDVLVMKWKWILLEWIKLSSRFFSVFSLKKSTWRLLNFPED